jgi:heat-inducible transcriptional repressor
MGSYELGDRARRLLTSLVQAHVETGEAVSSQFLAAESGLGVSSATVRTMLAQLEEAGLLHQPHTSAGRVPTDLGYRAFVDALLEARRPSRPSALVESRIRQHAGRSPLLDDVLANVSHVVSRAARQVGFAMAASDGAVLHRIEFVPLSDTRVLVVLVSQSGQVTQKAIEVDEYLSADELAQAARYLNTQFHGRRLRDVRDAVLVRLQQDRTLYDALLARALRLAQASLETTADHPSFHVEGVAALISDDAYDAVSPTTLRELLEMMDEKERMVRLLTQYIDGPGLTIIIGAEHTAPGLRPFSLVAATAVDDGATHTVGVIGPTRMDYSRTIALVDGTTQVVTRVLRDS